MNGGDDDSAVPKDADALRRRLDAVVSEARSLRDIEDWLRAQAWVAAVETEDYLIKTNPPRRAVTIDTKRPDGSAQRRQLIVVELPNGGYSVWDLREA